MGPLRIGDRVTALLLALAAVLGVTAPAPPPVASGSTTARGPGAPAGRAVGPASDRRDGVRDVLRDVHVAVRSGARPAGLADAAPDLRPDPTDAPPHALPGAHGAGEGPIPEDGRPVSGAGTAGRVAPPAAGARAPPGSRAVPPSPPTA